MELQSEIDTELAYRIINMLGEQISDAKIPLKKGNNIIRLDISGHDKGMYILNLINHILLFAMKRIC